MQQSTANGTGQSVSKTCEELIPKGSSDIFALSNLSLNVLMAHGGALTMKRL